MQIWKIRFGNAIDVDRVGIQCLIVGMKISVPVFGTDDVDLVLGDTHTAPQGIRDLEYARTVLIYAGHRLR